MSRRGTFVLALLVAVSGAYLWFDVRHGAAPAVPDASSDAPGLATPGAEPLLALAPEQVTTVRFRQGAATREAQRRDGGWTPDQANGVLDDFLRSLAQLPVLHEIPAASRDLGDYGLAPPHGSIELHAADRTDAVVLEIGDRNPPGSAVYVRLVDRGRVVLAGAVVRQDFDRTFTALAE